MRRSISAACRTLAISALISCVLAAPSARAQDATEAPPAEAPAAEAPAAEAPAAEAPAAEAPAAAPDAGAAPAFAGTWAADAAQCSQPQDSPNAPMIVTAAGFDQHEIHCSFKTITPDGAASKIAAECQVEGDQQPHDFSFAVEGDKLSVTDEAGTDELVRCP